MFNRATILVVDNDATTLNNIASVLQAKGHEAHIASDEHSAMKAASMLPLDLIICDVNLRGMSGLELCRAIQRECGMVDVPVMFMSATQTPDIIRRAHDMGGAYYIRKPFDQDVLCELVDRALWMPHLVNSRLQATTASLPIAPEIISKENALPKKDAMRKDGASPMPPAVAPIAVPAAMVR
jgi:DNA-binding response OmpR family regulator